MSLRIYIKGTPKFNSPKKTDPNLPLSPHFNTLPASKITRPSRKGLHATESREPSVFFETSPQRSENTVRTSGDNNTLSAPALRKKSSVTNQNSRYESHRDEDFDVERSVKSSRGIRTKPEIQREKHNYHKKIQNHATLPDRQLRQIVKESDEMIIGLFEEMERLHDFYIEKIKETGLSRNFQSGSLTRDSRAKFHTTEDQTERAEFEGEKSDQSRSTAENSRLVDMIRRLTSSNTELTEEVSLLREMASSGERTLQKERESFKALKEKVEDLMNLNDELDDKVKEKEKDIVRLEEGLQEALANSQKLMLEVKAKEQAIEEIRKAPLLGDLQSPIPNHVALKLQDDLNNTVASSQNGGGFGINTMNWGSILKMESPKDFVFMDRARGDVKDWQKKLDASKNDNAKLVKMVEGNQQVIKDLKQTFADLEERNSKRFEELKFLYENKIKVLTDENNGLKSGYRHHNETTEMMNDTQTKMNSIASSSQYHSKKASNESVWKNLRTELPGFAIYSQNTIEQC